ncbi:hypothetical protein FEM48_Zijuj12G0137700 [Ziziphus jujuba var. spinosa]|uniref:RRM domain-containing protein n=1 Tax=Ziziphus jujuba var. spinosa TaxID=714518 RepID=A0A978UDP2_ZIZJJ|nr:hypothetical protein FEM48_Zijuj12G0137700 [Ziziphus jujuba var. spinosa]
MAAFVRRIPGNCLQYTCMSNRNKSSSYCFSRVFSSTILVKGFPFSTTDERLAEVFSQFGEITEVKIVKNKDSNKSKGFGFVTFTSESDAQKAKMEMNGQLLDGRALLVDNKSPERHFKDASKRTNQAGG